MQKRATEILEWLVDTRIAGPHSSHSREDNVRKAEMLASGDPKATFGLIDAAYVRAREALLAVATVAGSGDPGAAYIDPTATLSSAIGAADRLQRACLAGASVLVATGHPTGLLSFYGLLAQALDRLGATIIRPLDNVRIHGPDGSGRIRYLLGVGALTDGGSILHTHSPWPMEEILRSGHHIDLVVGDHGFAGAAIQAGIPTVAVMDTNDPALAVGWASGRDVSLIPLDDNRPPDLYLPLAELMIERLH
ncbi:MAG: phosphatase [Actinomycetota bacterium]|nr:phosphatase [Actinomycetota bacterium]